MKLGLSLQQLRHRLASHKGIYFLYEGVAVVMLVAVGTVLAQTKSSVPNALEEVADNGSTSFTVNNDVTSETEASELSEHEKEADEPTIEVNGESVDVPENGTTTATTENDGNNSVRIEVRSTSDGSSSTSSSFKVKSVTKTREGTTHTSVTTTED